MKAFLGSCKVKNFLRASLGNSIYSDLSAFDFQVNLKSRRNNELVVKLHAVKPPFQNWNEHYILEIYWYHIHSGVLNWKQRSNKTWGFFYFYRKIFYPNSNACGMAVARPYGFESDSVRNPISGSAAWFFFMILKLIFTPIFEIKIDEQIIFEIRKKFLP